MIDDQSPPGSWERDLAARGLYGCRECGWVGRNPSITDASSLMERNGQLVHDRTHLMVCPACFEIISRTDTINGHRH